MPHVPVPSLNAYKYNAVLGVSLPIETLSPSLVFAL
jgi:hypothetical protein